MEDKEGQDDTLQNLWGFVILECAHGDGWNVARL